MLDFYCNYQINLNFINNNCNILLKHKKLINYFLFMQKLKFSNLNKISRTHLNLFYLYNKTFFKILIKKKNTKIKNLYFLQFQQYIY